MCLQRSKTQPYVLRYLRANEPGRAISSNGDAHAPTALLTGTKVAMAVHVNLAADMAARRDAGLNQTRQKAPISRAPRSRSAHAGRRIRRRPDLRPSKTHRISAVSTFDQAR
jgi:hypothetical protein